MNLQPKARETIRSASHWMLVVTVVMAAAGVWLLYRVREDPIPNLVGVVMSGWAVYALGRAAYAFTRPPTVVSLRAGLLGLRSFFRVSVANSVLFLAAGVVPTPVSCDLDLELNGPNGGTAAASDDSLEKELTKILVASLSSCTDRHSDECLRASEAAGAAIPPMHSMPERFSSAQSKGVCQRGTFAQLDFRYVYLNEDGETQRQGLGVGSFLRADTGEWFVLSVDDNGEYPEHCDVLPYHSASVARKQIVARSIDWDVTESGDSLDLSMFWTYGCVIDRIEVVVDPERAPQVLKPACWFEEGFPERPPGASHVVIEEPQPPGVTVRVVFEGDVRSAKTTVKNPRGENWDE